MTRHPRNDGNRRWSEGCVLQRLSLMNEVINAITRGSFIVSTSERYRSAAHTLYDQGIVELEAGDLRQASEKFWGAAAQAMKALAERKKWHHRSHRHFHATLDELADLDDHKDIVRWFGLAEALHINFYEDRASAETIAINAESIRQLIDRLERVE